MPAADQQAVYDAVGSELVRNTFLGYNNTLFAYGQTGSGKTYTMTGGGGDTRGITPRVCAQLFSRIAALRSEHSETSFTVRCSYMEIYLEQVYDLLAVANEKERCLRVREHPETGPFVDGLSTHPVSTLEGALELMSKGDEARRTAATRMNTRSSRSHAIFTVHFTSVELLTDADQQMFGGISTNTKRSKLNLVDLAGSERTKKSEAEGEHFTEATKINASLTALGRVIDALADLSNPHRRGPTIVAPYRDSTLTWILRDSIGGNSKTTMVATISPHAASVEETQSTLRYASRAREIVNLAVVNEDPSVRRIRELTAENERLKRELVRARDPAKVRRHESDMIDLRSTVERLAAELADEQDRSRGLQLRAHALENELSTLSSARREPPAKPPARRACKSQPRDDGQRRNAATAEHLRPRDEELEAAQAAAAQLRDRCEKAERRLAVSEQKARRAERELKAAAERQAEERQRRSAPTQPQPKLVRKRSAVKKEAARDGRRTATPEQPPSPDTDSPDRAEAARERDEQLAALRQEAASLAAELQEERARADAASSDSASARKERSAEAARLEGLVAAARDRLQAEAAAHAATKAEAERAAAAHSAAAADFEKGSAALADQLRQTKGQLDAARKDLRLATSRAEAERGRAEGTEHALRDELTAALRGLEAAATLEEEAREREERLGERVEQLCSDIDKQRSEAESAQTLLRNERGRLLRDLHSARIRAVESEERSVRLRLADSAAEWSAWHRRLCGISGEAVCSRRRASEARRRASEAKRQHAQDRTAAAAAAIASASGWRAGTVLWRYYSLWSRWTSARTAEATADRLRRERESLLQVTAQHRDKTRQQAAAIKKLHAQVAAASGEGAEAARRAEAEQTRSKRLAAALGRQRLAHRTARTLWQRRVTRSVRDTIQARAHLQRYWRELRVVELVAVREGTDNMRLRTDLAAADRRAAALEREAEASEAGRAEAEALVGWYKAQLEEVKLESQRSSGDGFWAKLTGSARDGAAALFGRLADRYRLHCEAVRMDFSARCDQVRLMYLLVENGEAVAGYARQLARASARCQAWRDRARTASARADRLQEGVDRLTAVRDDIAALLDGAPTSYELEEQRAMAEEDTLHHGVAAWLAACHDSRVRQRAAAARTALAVLRCCGSGSADASDCATQPSAPREGVAWRPACSRAASPEPDVPRLPSLRRCGSLSPQRPQRSRSFSRSESTQRWAPPIDVRRGASFAARSRQPAACSWCGAEGRHVTLRRCACAATTYCGQKCQLLDWKAGHRKDCSACDQ
eukprot:TRINITY_DN14777_c0_g1_i1.p1 TRINITY_DN14777_c0_g1~~TRINITY_DN14777_c0_g1_i1.p1  ORF type:complete len:1381 (+),score=522.53 TRINITY_DN14777_c0_g1_i1:279-4145(+)